MIRYEPPYVVHMIEKRRHGDDPGEGGVVYSSGNPADAESFASSLYETGASVVEVRDSTGQLVRRFPASEVSRDTPVQ